MYHTLWPPFLQLPFHVAYLTLPDELSWKAAPLFTNLVIHSMNTYQNVFLFRRRSWWCLSSLTKDMWRYMKTFNLPYSDTGGLSPKASCPGSSSWVACFPPLQTQPWLAGSSVPCLVPCFPEHFLPFLFIKIVPINTQSQSHATSSSWSQAEVLR